MGELRDIVDGLAADGDFHGVVHIAHGDEVRFAAAYGRADRAHGIPMTVDTRLGMASGSKGFTALAVLRLIEDGVLGMDTTARSVLGDDLPLIDDAVTVEHLLAHRSGIGDYLDEDDDVPIETYVLGAPAQELATTEAFLPLLDGHPTVFRPGERFAYCNGGYVVLALIAERASGVGYHELVRRTVCAPAGLERTDFLRSDALPGDAAPGYVEIDGEWRTNVFHLPVLATGDGGCHTTVADVHRFWTALFAGRIVPPAVVAEMVRPRSEIAEGPRRYGLGIWLHPTTDAVALEGYDAGVSFRSDHDPATGRTRTVIGATSPGAWPIVHALADRLDW